MSGIVWNSFESPGTQWPGDQFSAFIKLFEKNNNMKNEKKKGGGASERASCHEEEPSQMVKNILNLRANCKYTFLHKKGTNCVKRARFELNPGIDWAPGGRSLPLISGHCCYYAGPSSFISETFDSKSITIEQGLGKWVRNESISRCSPPWPSRGDAGGTEGWTSWLSSLSFIVIHHSYIVRLCQTLQ